MPIRANPEYYAGQFSERKRQPDQTSQSKRTEPLSFRTTDKSVDQQVLEFGAKKAPLSGTTLNVPAFKPKYRKSSHDFASDRSVNMVASEIFVKPSEKAKDNTPRAPTS